MTRHVPALAASTFVALLVAATAADADPKIQQGKNGIYLQSVGTGARMAGGIAYLVDSIAQLCFAHVAAGREPTATVIPCENLALRPGWEDIITWVDTEPATD